MLALRPIGLLVLTRSEVQPFTHEQIELVNTSATSRAIRSYRKTLVNNGQRKLQMICTRCSLPSPDFFENASAAQCVVGVSRLVAPQFRLVTLLR